MKKGPAVAIDLADIARFRAAFKAKNKRFFERSLAEPNGHTVSRTRTLRRTLPVRSLQKKRCAKLLRNSIRLFNEIEIRRELSGKPEVWVRGKKERSLSVSITHTKRPRARWRFIFRYEKSDHT